jgi:hypothetical protein
LAEGLRSRPFATLKILGLFVLRQIPFNYLCTEGYRPSRL